MDTKRAMDVYTALHVSAELEKQKIIMTAECFPICIKGTPGKQMSQAEKNCFKNCWMRMWETNDLVQKRLIQLQRNEQHE